MQASASLRVKYRCPEAAWGLTLLTSPFTSTTGGRTVLRISSIRCVSWDTDIGSTPRGPTGADGDRPLFRRGGGTVRDAGAVPARLVVLCLKSKKFVFSIADRSITRFRHDAPGRS